MHLEGDIAISTENRDNYIPHEVHQRCFLPRRDTTLHLQGELLMLPEYRDVFTEHEKTERRNPKLPINNLTIDGVFSGM